MSSSAESSSAEAIGWSTFRERAVPVPVDNLLSPASELEAALQCCWQHLDLERAAARDALADAMDAAATQAQPIFQLSAVLSRNEATLTEAGLGRVHRQLRVLRDQMLAALENCGLRMVDPVGQPLDELADAVDVLGWRYRPEFPDQVVAETVEPIVRHGTKVIRRGRVIMGAPEPSSSVARESSVDKENE